MTTLKDVLRRRLALEGPMTVAAFMTEALAHPRFGYYMRKDPFGVAGDFITAPEISQMFGELLGAWCAQAWMQSGSPARVRWVELGPGRGTLMQDAWRAVARVPGFPAAARVHLVETSPCLRLRQAAALAAVTPPPLWHDHLAEVPEGTALVLANEFFDALPIHQFVRTASGWAERLVDQDPAGDGFHFVLEHRPAGSITQLLPDALRTAPENCVVEVAPAAQSVMQCLAARLVQQGGAALVIDYGHPLSAPGDTLQALRRHAYVSVLADPGEADITAHVDFAALAATARAAGAEVLGPVTQGVFLTALGIELRAAQLRRTATPAQQADMDVALHRLTAPDAMGDLFKVMAVVAPGLGVLPGFVA